MQREPPELCAALRWCTRALCLVWESCLGCGLSRVSCFSSKNTLLFPFLFFLFGIFQRSELCTLNSVHLRRHSSKKQKNKTLRPWLRCLYWWARPQHFIVSFKFFLPYLHRANRWGRWRWHPPCRWTPGEWSGSPPSSDSRCCSQKWRSTGARKTRNTLQSRVWSAGHEMSYLQRCKTGIKASLRNDKDSNCHSSQRCEMSHYYYHFLRV